MEIIDNVKIKAEKIKNAKLKYKIDKQISELKELFPDCNKIHYDGEDECIWVSHDDRFADHYTWVRKAQLFPFNKILVWDFFAGDNDKELIKKFGEEWGYKKMEIID